MWKIPDPAKLLEARQVFSADAWIGETSVQVGMSVDCRSGILTKALLGFAEGVLAPRHVPVNISQPAFRLQGKLGLRLYEYKSSTCILMQFKGHQSIVNSALIHPSFLHIVTSGVERDILLHGAAPSSPCTHNMGKTSTRTRQIFPVERDHQVTLRDALRLGDEDIEELETITLFDQ